MKISLTIEGSASAIAAILASLPAEAGEGAVISNVGFVAAQTLGAMNAALDTDSDEAGEATDAATDKTGLPWDERIHSSNRKLKNDGSWTRRKGVDDAVFAAVTNELRSRVAGQPMVAGQPIPQPMQMPQPQPMQTFQPQPQPVAMAIPGQPIMQSVTQPQPTLTPIPQPQPVIQQPVAQPVAQPQPTGEMDMAMFMANLGPKMQAGTVDTAYIVAMTSEIATAFNVQLSAITDIAPNPAMIGYAVQIMQRDGRW